MKVDPTAYIFPDCIIGKNCRIGAGAIVGSLGVATEPSHPKEGKINRVEAKGIVVVENNVDIGANSVVHRGVEGNTVIGEGTFIGPLANIGHDVNIGKNCLILNGCIVCGWVDIGDNVRINPGSIIKNRVKIGSNATVGIGSLVMHDVPKGVTVVGRPAVEIEKFRKLKKSLT